MYQAELKNTAQNCQFAALAVIQISGYGLEVPNFPPIIPR
jgi:hypothetical protein